jgi:hypothetical protein
MNTEDVQALVDEQHFPVFTVYHLMHHLHEYGIHYLRTNVYTSHQYTAAPKYLKLFRLASSTLLDHITAIHSARFLLFFFAALPVFLRCFAFLLAVLNHTSLLDNTLFMHTSIHCSAQIFESCSACVFFFVNTFA